MKRFIAFIAALVLTFGMTASAIAAPSVPRVTDGADILSDSEEQALLDKLNAVSEALQFDIVIVTTDGLGGLTAEEYADKFFDDNGFGYGSDYDGVLLLLDMNERAYAISTSGEGITDLTDYGLQSIVDAMMGDLGSGRYASAFNTFTNKCEEYVKLAREDTPYDTYIYVTEPIDGPTPHRTGTYFDTAWIVMGLIAGFVLSLIITGAWKSKLKSVRQQYSAGSYVRSGSLALTESYDRFLYSNIARTPIPRDRGNNTPGGGGHFVGGGSTTHVSSGGHTHGGTSGHF